MSGLTAEKPAGTWVLDCFADASFAAQIAARSRLIPPTRSDRTSGTAAYGRRWPAAAG
jgi:hypothetical protein